ncbi:MAG: DMT family transporter [Burkholderiales bacterium]
MNPELGAALAIASMLCFASNMLISRYAMTRMPIDSGFFIVLSVNVVVCGAIFLVDLATRDAPFEFQAVPALNFAAAGLVGAYLGRRLLFEAVRLLGPARTSVFHSCAPVPTMVFAWLLVGETLGLYEISLMAMVLVGLWITQPPGRDMSVSRGDRASLRKGAIFGLLTITGFAASNAIRGHAVREWDEAMFGTLLGAAAALAMQAAMTRDWKRIAREFRAAPRSGLILYGAGGLATLGGAYFLISASKHIEIALAALITHTTPIVVFPFSVFVLGNGEGLTRRTFVGVALVLAGITLLTFR